MRSWRNSQLSIATTTIRMTISHKNGTLVALLGPTGSGKTDLSVELARRLGAPVLSFDSRQVFRGMAVGTAQPAPEQLSAVKHYFIADRDITAEYNSGIFEKEAIALLETLFADSPYVIAVGGSGLYIDALCYGLDDLPTGTSELRRELEARLEREGLEKLAEELALHDPVYGREVDRNNPARVLRALEVCLASGRPYSEQRTGRKVERPFGIVKAGIDMPRGELYERIDRRVDMMMEAGLEDEARKLYPFRGLNSLNTVGYRELFGYFDGSVSREEAVSLIKRNSRRYAKRQLTWFRRDPGVEWLDLKKTETLENFLKKFAE